jgi:hypothetical protein
MEGHTALKFLLAGGVAGAGVYLTCHVCEINNPVFMSSLKDVNSSFRSNKNFPHNSSPRSR